MPVEVSSSVYSMKDPLEKIDAGERPDTSGRDKAVSREVTPCSEYTRFSSEGRLKDPFSQDSAVMDKTSMSNLFISGPFKKPKWSRTLGYGMAVIDEDTRLHLHASGKYVIRRARDEEHALNCYRVVSEISRPALYSTHSNRFLWEIIRDASYSDDANMDEEEMSVLTWPSGSGDPEKILSSSEEGFIEARERFLGPILEKGEDILSAGDENGILIEEYRSRLFGLLDGGPPDHSILLGYGSFISAVSHVISRNG